MNRITIILLTGVYLFLVSACSEPEDDPPVGADLEGDIVFSSDRTGFWEVYMMDIDGSDLVQLTDNNYDAVISPKFSPDGTTIYFRAYTATLNRDIIIMNRDGTGQINLTNTPESERTPYMSPDGLYICYTISSPGRVAIMNSDGSNKRLPAENITYARVYGFSPAGDYILCTGIDSSGTDYNVFLVPVDGSAAINMTKAYDNLMGPYGTAIHSAYFSPDGSQLAYTINKQKSGQNSTNTYADIYIIEADGTNLVQLTSNEEWSSCLGFSLDGEKILYFEWEVDPLGDADLMTVNTDGTDVRNITNSGDSIERTGQFIDGNRIVYETSLEYTSHSNFEIFIIDELTGIATQLTDNPAFDRGPDVFMP